MMKVRFTTMSRCVLFGLAAIAPAILAQSANAATINVLTVNTGGVGSFDFLTGGRFNNVRDSLLNPLNYGEGGIVSDTVNYLPSVTELTSTNLSGVDVVLLAHGASNRSASELAALEAFVQNGGGMLAFGNEVASDLSSILGSTWGGYRDGIGIRVSNASSPIANGPFGTFAAGTFTRTSFGSFFREVGENGTVGITRGGDPFAATYDFGKGRAAVFLDEEMFVSASLGGADARWNTTHNAYFNNAFSHVIPDDDPDSPHPTDVPEPSSLLMLGAAGILGISGLGLKHRRKQ
ncbi:MAG: PEP-CTERM sorting domain-containing protein [Cyanobacteria bacterium SBLK]|nr:PEP-CTERM sorting domain-containing protein [Cyanobacteria bacterium SBLK]